jgi:hypothetical protein
MPVAASWCELLIWRDKSAIASSIPAQQDVSGRNQAGKHVTPSVASPTIPNFGFDGIQKNAFFCLISRLHA